MANVDQTMRFLSEFSSSALGQATNTIGRASFWETTPGSVDFKYNPLEPDVDIPIDFDTLLAGIDDGSTDIRDQFNMDKLKEKTLGWLDDNLPQISECIQRQPDDWICGILDGSAPFGMNREAFDQAWHDGRDRAYRQAGSEKRQIDALFALRGFTQAPGAHATAMINAEVRAADAIADINRQQTIKDEEVRVELVKLAVQVAAQIKASMYSMLSQFLRGVIDLQKYDPGIEKMRARAQLYSAFVSRLNSFYQTEVQLARLRLDAAKAESAVDETNIRLKIDGSAKGIDSRNSALGNAANGFATAAGAAANAASSLQAELYSGTLG